MTFPLRSIIKSMYVRSLLIRYFNYRYLSLTSSRFFDLILDDA